MVAPTGIAASRLGGFTIQCALALQREGKEITQRKLAELMARYDRTILMVCDEVSMLGPNMKPPWTAECSRSSEIGNPSEVVGYFGWVIFHSYLL